MSFNPKRYQLSTSILNLASPLSRATNNYLENHFQYVEYKKNDLIVSKGEVIDKIFVIRKGLVRGFEIINSKEITHWVSLDNEIFTAASFFSQTPSIEIIQCLEDCKLDYLTYKDLYYAIHNFKDFSAMYHRVLEQYYYAAQIRSIISRIPNSKSRFSYFVENYDINIINRCPDKYLASFININPETFSRLKSEYLTNQLKG